MARVCGLSLLAPWLVVLANLLAAGQADVPSVTATTVIYGKYYSKKAGVSSATDNSYYLYRPSSHDAAQQGPLPVIVHFHGGGFTEGTPQTSSADADVKEATRNGIAYISVGYRLVAAKYHFGNDTPEELIHVDSEGRLSLDAAGKTMEDYRIRRGRQEYNTKCSYDAVQMMEHLIAHADAFGIDIHRISFCGDSAGGGEIQYLTWVYHQWNVGRYTPAGMVYVMAQLDYPVQNMMDRTWKLWTDDVGEHTKLSAILAQKDCGMIIGNPCCLGGEYCGESDYNLCNMTWQNQSMARFCAPSGFASATLGQVRDAQLWPAEDPEVGQGMPVLWYASLNMQRHQPKPFYLYVANPWNSTEGLSVVHSALYARNFAKYAEMAGINFTVYYTDYKAMVAADVGDQRFAADDGLVWNYRSSHDWVQQPGLKELPRVSSQEQLMYHCLALGVVGCSSPLPLFPQACQQAIDKYCPTQSGQQDCAACITSHERALIAGGCPQRADQGFDTCLAYCKSRGTPAKNSNSNNNNNNNDDNDNNSNSNTNKDNNNFV